MLIVGIIPARYESSRFPGKPLADIHGKPMIQHVYERARKTPRLDRLVVATDDERIFRTVEGFGGEAVMTGSHHPSGTDRLAEAAVKLGLSERDIVVNIQGDEPLVAPEMIHGLIEALVGADDSPMATLAFESRNRDEYLNPNVVKVVVDRQGKALYFSRSPLPFCRDGGNEPVPFLKHLGFYAYRDGFLQEFTKLPPGALENMEKLEQLRAMEHGHTIRVALSPMETLGVDTPEDLEQVLKSSAILKS
ncbi:MAG: 3-deoxy-manno-octulosonate cytidylyltransferase [Acidobacteriota bacterium]